MTLKHLSELPIISLSGDATAMWWGLGNYNRTRIKWSTWVTVWSVCQYSPRAKLNIHPLILPFLFACKFISKAQAALNHQIVDANSSCKDHHFIVHSYLAVGVLAFLSVGLHLTVSCGWLWEENGKGWSCSPWAAHMQLWLRICTCQWPLLLTARPLRSCWHMIVISAAGSLAQSFYSFPTEKGSVIYNHALASTTWPWVCHVYFLL